MYTAADSFMVTSVFSFLVDSPHRAFEQAIFCSIPAKGQKGLGYIRAIALHAVQQYTNPAEEPHHRMRSMSDVVVVVGEKRFRNHRRTWRRRNATRCTLLALTTYALLSCLRVTSFTTTTTHNAAGGCAYPRGCQLQQRQQQRWSEGRLCHVSRRSDGGCRARIARARMVATEGSRPALSPPQPSPSSAAAEAARATSSAGVSPGVSNSDKAEGARASRLKVATFFFLWYTFNVGYNLCTKFT